MLDSHADLLANVPLTICSDGGQVVPPSEGENLNWVGVLTHCSEN